MPTREQDDLPYRSAVPQGIVSSNKGTTTNEQNYDTLKNVLKTLDTRIEGLYKDFNAFDVVGLLQSSELDDAQKKLLVQILAKQQAYDVLIEAREAINSVLITADQKYKQRS